MRIVVPVADVRGGPDAATELVTQAVLGEEVVLVAGGPGDWLRVVCPEQPSALDPRGYPGWVRAGSVGGSAPGRSVGATGRSDPDWSSTPAATSVEEFIAAARSFDGAPYLWGGVTREGVDCSGLVHMALRAVGLRVPRDAADQHRAAPPVAREELRRGDLCFFAVDGADVHHVGVATGRGVMLHAPEAGVGVVEERIDAAHLATLVGGGRVVG